MVSPITRTIGSRGEHLFTGAVKPEQFPTFSRAIFRMIGGRWGDYRNWPEVEAWADSIANALRADKPPVTNQNLDAFVDPKSNSAAWRSRQRGPEVTSRR